MSCGIIMEGDASELISPLCERLNDLGLFRGSVDSLTPELLCALNVYRSANRIIPLDFCDPATLRTLGIDCTGDELLYIARCAQSISESELGCYSICCEIVRESREFGITLIEAANRRRADMTPELSPWAMTAAILAFLDQ